MTRWLHSRKGIIRGYLVRDEGVWLAIRITGDQILKTARGVEQVQDGEIITVRKSFTRELPAPDGSEVPC